jgi:spermidine synthase
VKGTSSLYSKEYFELVKQHLNPGGVVTQWVPLYESDEDTVRSEIATFFDVFPNGTVWGNDINGEGYDIVLLGQAEPTHINIDQMDDRLAQSPRLAQSLASVSFRSANDLLSTYAGRAPDLAGYLKGAEINNDSAMRLQYLAGMGVSFDRPALIYSNMLAARRFPPDLFTGSDAKVAQLRFTLAR